MIAPVCLDASVIVKALTREEGTVAAARLLERVVEQEGEVVVPDLALLEVGSVLRQKVSRGLLQAEHADLAWRWFRRLEFITYVTSSDYADRAWDLSKEFSFPVLYGAAYLAVAETIAIQTGAICEFWTADKMLFDQIKQRKQYVRLLSGS